MYLQFKQLLISNSFSGILTYYLNSYYLSLHITMPIVITLRWPKTTDMKSILVLMFYMTSIGTTSF